MSNYKTQKLMVSFVILAFIFIQFALTIFVCCNELIQQKQETTIEKTSSIIVTPTPAPTPTVAPRVTLPIFEQTWNIEYESNIPTWEKEEIALQCDNLIVSIYNTQYSNSEEAIGEAIHLEAVRDLYMADVEAWNAKVEEYPIACEVWVYLTEGQGMNDVQAAAIIGNMMVECGGYTLYLDPYAYSSGFYGLCQWSTSYHYSVNGADMYEQLDYLMETLESEFQYSSVTYNQFISATIPEDASVYFARGYERCANPYGRQNCAREAYDYFCS